MRNLAAGVGVILLFLGGCQNLNNLQGNAAEETASGTDEFKVVNVKPLSMYEWEVVIDNTNFASQAASVSNYSSDGGIVILSAFARTTTNIILFVSNQKAGDRVRLSVRDRYITNSIPAIGVSFSSSNTNAEVAHLIGDSFTLDTFGSDDSTPPSLSIMNPYEGYQHNEYVQNSVIDVMLNMDDNVGIASVSYHIDSQPEVKVSESAVYQFSFNITPLAAGEHSLIVLVKDYSGNETTAHLDFAVSRVAPSLWAYPQNGCVILTGGTSNDVQFRAYSSDGTTTEVYAKVTTLSNSYTVPLSGGPNNWSAYYYPSQWDSDTNEVQYYFVNASHVTNALTGKFYYYERDMIYVSQNGSDGYLGTIYKPLRTPQAAVSRASSSVRKHIRLARGGYSDIRISAVPNMTGVVLSGGYSLDFQTCDPSLYPSQVSTGYLYQANNLILSNIFSLGSLEMHYCSGLKIYNYSAVLSHSGWTMLIMDCVNNTVLSNCAFARGQFGADVVSSMNNKFQDCRFVSNSTYGFYMHDSPNTADFYNCLFDNYNFSGNSFVLTYCTGANNFYNCAFNHASMGLYKHNSQTASFYGCDFIANNYCGCYISDSQDHHLDKLQDCRIMGNRRGIVLSISFVTVSGCRIADNKWICSSSDVMSQLYGIGLYLVGSHCVISDCEFENNILQASAGRGAGACIYGTWNTVSDCSFVNNQLLTHGGCFSAAYYSNGYTSYSGWVPVPAYGAGIAVVSGNQLLNCTYSGNTSAIMQPNTYNGTAGYPDYYWF